MRSQHQVNGLWVCQGGKATLLLLAAGDSAVGVCGPSGRSLSALGASRGFQNKSILRHRLGGMLGYAGPIQNESDVLSSMFIWPVFAVCWLEMERINACKSLSAQ